MEAERPIPVAVVGCGAIASRLHLPLLHERRDVVVRALVDVDRTRAEELARRYEVPVVASDHTSLAGSGVQAAIVTVPNHLHAPVACGLLEAGIHVLVEKPLAPTSAACQAMIAAAERGDALLVPALPLRFSHAAAAATVILDSGMLGTLTDVRIAYGAGVGWPAATDHLLRAETAGGGALLDLGSHVLDLLLRWFGDAEVVSYRDDAYGGVEADVQLELTTTRCPRIHVELSRTRDLEQTAVFVGERATLTVGIGNDRVELDVHGDAALEGHARPAADVAHGQDLDGLFRAIHDDLFAAITAGREPVLSAGDAARSIALIETCYAQRRPLRLPWVTFDERSSDLTGKRVLVTGASGFIGGRVAELLAVEHGAQVRALIRSAATATRVARLPVDFVRGSLDDPEALDDAVRGCDVVVNCAHDVRSRGRNRGTGVVGTELLANAALRAGVDRLVHVSSAVVYGTGHPGDLTETMPWEPATNSYVAAKQAGERLLTDLHHRRGLPVVTIQPTIVYGPWGDVWTARCLEQLSTGLLALPDGGVGRCNAVYVDDVAHAIVLAATVPAIDGEAFLVSASKPVTWRMFYGAFEGMLGRQAVIDVPRGMLPRLSQRERRRVRRGLVRSTAGGLRRAVINRATTDALQQLPAAQRTAGLLLDVLPADRWEQLKPLMRGGRGPHSGNGDASAPMRIHVPTADDTALYCSSASVRIDKAERMLGYRPRFDLDEGMRLTTEFARWARLADGDRSGSAG